MGAKEGPSVSLFGLLTKLEGLNREVYIERGPFQRIFEV